MRVIDDEVTQKAYLDLLEGLVKIAERQLDRCDEEVDHKDADLLLIEFACRVGGESVPRQAFDLILKWYA